jgi:hypothetical protein
MIRISKQVSYDVHAADNQSQGLGDKALAPTREEGRSTSGVRGFIAFAGRQGLVQPRLPLGGYAQRAVVFTTQVNGDRKKVLPELSPLRVIRTPRFGMWMGLKHSERGVAA